MGRRRLILWALLIGLLTIVGCGACVVHYFDGFGRFGCGGQRLFSGMGDHIFNFHPYAQTQQDFRNATPKFNPRWTADGSQIVFAIGRGTDQPIDGRVYVVAANGSSLTPITVGTGDYVIDHSPDIAPDGSQIVLSSYRVLGGSSGDFGDFERHFELTTSTLDGADQKRVTSNSG